MKVQINKELILEIGEYARKMGQVPTNSNKLMKYNQKKRAGESALPAVALVGGAGLYAANELTD